MYENWFIHHALSHWFVGTLYKPKAFVRIVLFWNQI